MKFWLDENFNGDMLHALLTLHPEFDVERVQDTEFSGLDAPALLEEAANRGIILITHDFQTMAKFAIVRVNAGLPMPGVIEVARRLPISVAVAEISVLMGAGVQEDFDNLIWYVPIR